MKTKFGIFPRLLLTMILVAIVPLGANWWINYQASLERLSNQVEQQLSAQADGLATYVDTWMEMNLKLLRQNASLDDMISMDPAKQLPILRAIVKEYDKWLFIAFSNDTAGMNIARSDTETLKSFADRAWFQNAMKGPYGADVQIARSYGRPTFALAVPIVANDQKIVGVLTTASWVADLSQIITGVKIGKTGYAYLLSAQGKVVAHHKKAYTEILADFSKNAALTALGQASKKKVEFVDDATNKKVISFAQRSKYGWVVIIQQDHDEAYAPVNEANRNALIVLGATLTVVILISFVVARRLSRPILNMTSIADNISRGELGAKVKEINRSDEIGELARAVDRLGTSMRLAIERLSKR